MANTVKVTKADMFNAIKAVPAVAENEAFVAFIDHELELLAKKSASRKPTKTQEANESLKVVIANAMSTFDAPATVSEIQAADATLVGLSTQKMSAVISMMVKDGTVVKTMDKKKALFSLVDADSED